MRRKSKRIEVQFPAIPAPHALISISNQGVMARKGNAGNLQATLVLNEQTWSMESSPERRGIPESALND
jgi:hypothetical protein